MSFFDAVPRPKCSIAGSFSFLKARPLIWIALSRLSYVLCSLVVFCMAYMEYGLVWFKFVQGRSSHCFFDVIFDVVPRRTCSFIAGGLKFGSGGPLMCYVFLLCFPWRTWSAAWCGFVSLFGISPAAVFLKCFYRCCPQAYMQNNFKRF